MPPGDGVTVPAQLCRPLARLAVTGARAIQDRDGGLPLREGMAGLLAELAAVASDGPVRTVEGAAGSWLTVRRAAEMTGISCSRIRELAHGGRLIARKFGRDWQIDESSIAGYAKGRKIG